MQKYLLVILSVVLFVISPLFVLKAGAMSSAEERIIIIDAGHGGFDGGAVADDGTMEKDINLQIAQKTNDFAKLFGFTTIMTRDEDTALCDSESSVRKNKIEDMRNRLKIIKDNPKAVFLSIHINKFEQESVKGAQVFYSPNNEKSLILAQNIQSAIIRDVQNDNTRVVKKSDNSIYLLKNAKIPAVIVECGFLSNRSEINNLKSTEYQSKLAFSIVMSMNLYYNSIT